MMSIAGSEHGKLDTFVSVICITDNDATTIGAFLPSLSAELARSFSDYEILLIDQRSDDGTLGVVESLLSQIPSVRFIELSFRVPGDVALAAGLENAIGDIVVLMSPTHDPVSVVRPLVEQCHAGSDIVVGTSRQPETAMYQLAGPLIHSLQARIGYRFPRNATSLLCMSRRAVNTVTQTGRFHHQLSIRIANSGYKLTSFPYDLQGTPPKRGFLQQLRSTIRMLVFNSNRPLRWMSAIGLMGSGLAFLFSLYSLLVHLVKSNVVEGWTTTILVISSLSFLQFVILAFFGEYLGRLLDNRGEHHEYSVVFEKNSSVMVDENRHNVLHEPLSERPSAIQTGRDR